MPGYGPVTSWTFDCFRQRTDTVGPSDIFGAARAWSVPVVRGNRVDRFSITFGKISFTWDVALAYIGYFWVLLFAAFIAGVEQRVPKPACSFCCSCVGTRINISTQ